MASSFEILVHQNCSNTHLKLTGDFDETSAQQLISALMKYCRVATTIFVHTNSLRQILPLGLSAFRVHLDALRKGSVRLIFTGDHAPQLDA